MTRLERKRQAYEKLILEQPHRCRDWAILIQCHTDSGMDQMTAMRRQYRKAYGVEPLDDPRYEVIRKGPTLYIRLAEGHKPEQNYKRNHPAYQRAADARIQQGRNVTVR